MARKVKIIVKINLKAAEATPAPPVGTALGQHGVAIMEFVKQYNDKTKDLKGQVAPAVITIYDDRSFTFIIKSPPSSILLKRACGVAKASGVPHKEKVGSVTREQVREIAKIKMPDLNTTDIEQAIKIVAGTARSMGIDVVDSK